VVLYGLSARPEWFRNIPLSLIGILPLDALPHRGDAGSVETEQFQLWLGLRAVTSITGNALAVPPAVLERTLDLWRVNLAESSKNPASTEHRVNQSMVNWLEKCARGDQGLLLPPEEKRIELTHARGGGT
jgi:hypothetical protein